MPFKPDGVDSGATDQGLGLAARLPDTLEGSLLA